MTDDNKEIADITEKLDSFNEEPKEYTDIPDGLGIQELDDPAEDTTPGSILSSLEMDEPIFDGGPTRAETEAIKEKLAPGTKLMLTGLADGMGILWKTLNRQEWRQLNKSIEQVKDSVKREDLIFSKICISPDMSDTSKIDLLPAGAVPTVMQEFYVHSGFSAVFESMQL